MARALKKPKPQREWKGQRKKNNNISSALFSTPRTKRTSLRATVPLVAEPCQQTRPRFEWRGRGHGGLVERGGGGGGEGVTTLERKRQRKVREREKEEENQNSKSTSEVEGFDFSLFHQTLAFHLPSLLNCMGSLATFAPAAARPCTSVAPNTSRSSNLAAPRAAGCAARVSAVVALVRSPKQQSCSSSSSSSSFGRRSSIVVARAATVATASLPPLAPLDGKERGRKRKENDAKVSPAPACSQKQSL